MTDVHMIRITRNRYSEQTRKTSTFPSILTQYTTPDPRVKKHQVHWSWRVNDGKDDRKCHRKSPDELDNIGSMIEKRGKTERRAMKIDAVAKEQMARYDSYIKRLNEKVVRQREEIRRRAEELESRLMAEEEERQRARKARKTQRLSPIHDPDHYKKYPKTRFGKIVLLQDDLRKKGMLRCQEDVDRFWRRKMDDLGIPAPSDQGYFGEHDLASTSRSDKLMI